MAAKHEGAFILPDTMPSDPLEMVRLGIEAARKENYEAGLALLAEAYRHLVTDREGKLPPSALSYYGLCLALHTGKTREAVNFCQLAVEKEFYNPESYLNLARVWDVARNRRKAIEVLEKGLSIDARHKGLITLRVRMGVRKGPVLPFLDRDNPVNVTLGRVRASIRKSPKKAPVRHA